MPQLDKYIFFNQIIYLIVFFTLIYIFLRGTVIPKMSTILKYRSKKFNLLNNQLHGFNTLFNKLETVFIKIGKKYTTVFLDFINDKLNNQKTNSLNKIISLHDLILKKLGSNVEIINIFNKSKKELICYLKNKDISTKTTIKN